MWIDDTRPGYTNSWELAYECDIKRTQLNRLIRNIIKDGFEKNVEIDYKWTNKRKEICYWMDKSFIREVCRRTRSNKNKYKKYYYRYFYGLEEEDII